MHWKGSRELSTIPDRSTAGAMERAEVLSWAAAWSLAYYVELQQDHVPQSHPMARSGLPGAYAANRTCAAAGGGKQLPQPSRLRTFQRCRRNVQPVPANDSSWRGHPHWPCARHIHHAHQSSLSPPAKPLIPSSRSYARSPAPSAGGAMARGAAAEATSRWIATSPKSLSRTQSAS